ncbi:MAG: hypothetical protein [Wendovervirus sonii]|uniref:Uncharacterized protein n=1 Tax=phage Lak_Megaphage_Sonny TaxID=3109229 RepID=A0ABZ0Z5E4_9CAUD|nr:MAG: hypothetical protein [phage Lak_Megaphage_Sonny]
MKNLYKKIYEAINTGIQKALVLDDEDDISMNYQHTKIVNNENLLPYYVDELLQNPTNKFINYKQIIKYYEETGYKYKVKNFEELKTIFNKIKKFKNVSWEWISNIKDYVSIILEDNTEINFYEKTDKKSLFLKLANDYILGTENEILIYLHDDHYIQQKFQWQTKEAQIQDDKYLIKIKNYGRQKNIEKTKEIAEKDYSGYENCLRIQDIVSKDPNKYGDIPAIAQCLKLNINGYQGYLPSMGQLRIMYDNIDMINYIFKYLNLNEIKDLDNTNWQSSTENGFYSSWILCYGGITYYNYYKNYTNNHIFPFFAVKKN